MRFSLGISRSLEEISSLSHSIVFLCFFACSLRTSLVAQVVKNLCAMQETWVRSLGQEDPLENGMAIHSSILNLENPMDRGAWKATVHGVPKSWTDWATNTFTFHFHLGRLSYLSLLFFGTVPSDGYIFPFLLCLLLLFFFQVFVRPPQTAILHFAVLFLGEKEETKHPEFCQ